GRRACPATLAARAPVAQGIERCPAEAEVASSNLAGRISPRILPGALPSSAERENLAVGGREDEERARDHRRRIRWAVGLERSQDSAALRVDRIDLGGFRARHER